MSRVPRWVRVPGPGCCSVLSWCWPVACGRRACRSSSGVHPGGPEAGGGLPLSGCGTPRVPGVPGRETGTRGRELVGPRLRPASVRCPVRHLSCAQPPSAHSIPSVHNTPLVRSASPAHSASLAASALPALAAFLPRGVLFSRTASACSLRWGGGRGRPALAGALARASAAVSVARPATTCSRARCRPRSSISIKVRVPSLSRWIFLAWAHQVSWTGVNLPAGRACSGERSRGRRRDCRPGPSGQWSRSRRTVPWRPGVRAGPLPRSGL